MNHFEDLPDSTAERAAMLEKAMVASCTGNARDEPLYDHLRREFMADPATKALLPEFVRSSRSLGAFWPWIRDEEPSYAGRRRLISLAFTPLIEYLAGTNQAPADQVVGDALSSFDVEGVHTIWMKALTRREADPEGAITMARTLLETVCKQIIDRNGGTYGEADDLPKLYGAAARLLHIAPSQHSEEAFRAILGGCHTIVNGLGTLRNRLSDAHGRGGKPVKAAPRHASLAVNVAGAMATFLVETYTARLPG